MKTCSQCGSPDNGFYKHKRHADGLDSFCKKCRDEASKKYYGENRHQLKETQARYRADHAVEIQASKRLCHLNRPEVQMCSAARRRAKKRGTPFSITPNDIRAVWPPGDICEVLGLPLDIGSGEHTDYSPTLDAFNPALGYVLGNIRVISFRANRLKSNVTDPAELERVAAWMRARLSDI